MLLTEVTKIVIAPRRQARKERVLLISPNLGAFASLRESSLSGSVRQIHKNFKYLWLDFEFVLVIRMVLGLLLSEGNSIMPYVKAKDGVDIYYEVYGHGTPFIFLSETACDGA